MTTARRNSSERSMSRMAEREGEAREEEETGGEGGTGAVEGEGTGREEETGGVSVVVRAISIGWTGGTGKGASSGGRLGSPPWPPPLGFPCERGDESGTGKARGERRSARVALA